MEDKTEYNAKQVARSVAKKLQTLCNRAWSIMNTVRVEEGDALADELEEANRFLESVMEEAKLLAF